MLTCVYDTSNKRTVFERAGAHPARSNFVTLLRENQIPRAVLTRMANAPHRPESTSLASFAPVDINMAHTILGNSIDVKHYLELSGNPHTPASALQRIFEFVARDYGPRYYRTLRNLSTNPNTPPVVLDSMAKRDLITEELAIAVARHPNIWATTLDIILANATTQKVRLEIIKHPRTSLETIHAYRTYKSKHLANVAKRVYKERKKRSHVR